MSYIKHKTAYFNYEIEEWNGNEMSICYDWYKYIYKAIFFWFKKKKYHLNYHIARVTMRYYWSDDSDTIFMFCNENLYYSNDPNECYKWIKSKNRWEKLCYVSYSEPNVKLDYGLWFRIIVDDNITQEYLKNKKCPLIIN